ncbi:MAG TPA: glycosyltransferase family 2 protein [Spirochaetota bacterium]|nr:glycosyltransferase family 2 protein [Spirochaetota bacterium]
MKKLAIIPAYNEERIIVSVIDEIKGFDESIDILIINDASTDRTGQVAAACGRAIVINLPCNLGIGGAVQTGFKYAARYGYDIAFQYDGDGQHIASEISKLVRPLELHEAEVVIGSRFCTSHNGFKSTLVRRIGIKIFKIVNSLLVRQWICDNTSGFRAYNKRAIQFLSSNYPGDYPEPEAVILLGRNGFRMVEVFTEMRERPEGYSSITAFKAVYYMIKVLLAIFMCALRPKIVKE